MLHYEHEQQRVIAAIADMFDLEPRHFEVKWNSEHPAEPIEIVGENVMALAYGRHNIPLDNQDWGIVSLPVK